MKYGIKVILLAAAILSATVSFAADEPAGRAPARFNTNFPGAAIGKIEALGDDVYRCAVDGQYNQYGRNRQPSWFYFRMDDVKGRKITIRLCDLKGEYNNRPSRGDWSKERPVFSDDNENWSLVPEVQWEPESGEFLFTITPKRDTIWLAYTPPYLPEHFRRLVRDVEKSARLRIEVVGKTLEDRDIEVMTMTDFSVPDETKRHYWIFARLHAWEALSSWVADGLVRFLCDEKAPEAAKICREAIVHVAVMPEPDSCIHGKIRYNLNGFDNNRNWARIDLRSKQSLADRKEVWYLKKAIWLSHLAKPVDVVFNLHNHQTGYDYIVLNGDGESLLQWYKTYSEKMEVPPYFSTNPKSRGRVDKERVPGGREWGSADELWDELAIPHVLVEYNVNRKTDTDYYLTVPDAKKNGERLIRAIHESWPEKK